MVFKVAARTVLELGAELISADNIALYELIKNAIDAGSRRAIIDITTVFKHSEYRNAQQRSSRARARVALDEADEDDQLEILKREILSKVEDGAPADLVANFTAQVRGARTIADLETRLTSAYEDLNYIDVIDTGEGMTLDALGDVFLTIGTTSRLLAKDGRHYVGGKGIGRLSAMRLGDRMEVKTTTSGEAFWNHLDIDWRIFSHDDGLLETVAVAPSRGSVRKDDPQRQGTEIRLRSLKADWDRDRVRRLTERYFDRLFDPFGDKARFPLVIRVNGRDVPINVFDDEVLAEALAKAEITYSVHDGAPKFILNMDYVARGRTKVEVWSRDDILGLTSKEDISLAALETLGPFTAKFHWFNRQRLKAIEGYGDREKVKDTVNHWANGLLMYRDGYRVNPYGNADDDWLSIDMKALGSAGYKVNRKQLVGAVYITAKGNPRLIDQTNREGLRANEEKALLVLLMQKAITENFKNFLNTVEKEFRKSSRMTVVETEAFLNRVDARVKRTMAQLMDVVPEQLEEEVDFLETTYAELIERLADAKVKLSNVEREQRDLVDLAGVGLQVEIVAHELARITRRTLDLIATLPAKGVPPSVASTMGTIESQMLVIRKRLDVLDPLGPSSRNRKAKVDLLDLVRMVVESHQDQFARNAIEPAVRTFPPEAKSFEIRAVRGMIVQVVENLIDNSVFWLRQRLRADPSFRPRLTVDVDVAAGEVRVTDNGPGVPVGRSEEIFLPFVSFKPPGEGKGLGLFISREIARRHSSDLYLKDAPDDEDRLHTFVLDFDGN